MNTENTDIAGRLDAWVSYTSLAALIVTWIVLAVTMPTATNRDLTFDVSCTSGHPVVGAWVESASGGSGWASEGPPGSTRTTRFTFRQVFTGDYQVNAGCGGSSQQWGVPAESTMGEAWYRRLVCDDLHVPPSGQVHCRDMAPR